MRIIILVPIVLAVSFCSGLAGQTSSIPQANAQSSERLSDDAPKSTVLGNTFLAPKDWSIRVKAPATILEAPEGNSWIALVDIQAK